MDDLLIKFTEALKKRQVTVAVAESCTGGLIAGLLTDLAGSSIWFERGFVTYSNIAKEEMLGIDAELIRQYGAVSKEVVEAMVLGALNNSHADLSLAVTGVAGPSGGSLEKPLGTVWFAWAMRKKPLQSLKLHFKNSSRQQVRQLACLSAIEGAHSYLAFNNSRH